MLKIATLELNPFSENTYVVIDTESNECLVIDPGFYDSTEEEVFTKYVNENNLTVKFILNTHCHLDHCFGNKFVKENFLAPLIIPKEDEYLFDKLELQATWFSMKFKRSPKPDSFFNTNESIFLNDFEIIPLFTPGHTAGEYCLYIPKAKICFTGDVIFAGSIGRTDLEGGNTEQLLSSIRSQILTLPDDTILYPGHGEPTTVGVESNTNPFLT